MTEHWRKLFDEARHEYGKNNIARAEELVSQAIQVAERISPNTRSYSSAQSTFALWEHFHERFATAEVFQRRYIEAEKHLGIGDRELGYLLMWLADMQRRQGKLVVAMTTIEEAIDTYSDGCLPEIAEAHHELSDVLKDMGNLALAAQFQNTAIELQSKWDEIVAERQRGLSEKQAR